MKTATAPESGGAKGRGGRRGPVGLKTQTSEEGVALVRSGCREKIPVI